MELVTRPPWAALGWGIAMALAVGIAVFGFGAPGWILIPVSWAGITARTLMAHHVDRVTGKRRY